MGYYIRFNNTASPRPSHTSHPQLAHTAKCKHVGEILKCQSDMRRAAKRSTPYVFVNTSYRQAIPVKSFAANPDELALPLQVKGPAVAVDAAITEYENPDVIFS